MAKAKALPGQTLLEAHIRGRAPLLMHSCRAVDPRDPIRRAMKQITAKKMNKTGSDEELLADLEWLGCLYTERRGELTVSASGARLENSGSIIVPSSVIEGAIRDAAKITRQGKNVVAGLECPTDAPLIYDGAEDVNALCSDPNFRDVRRVSVQRKGVMRTRPLFRNWSLIFSVCIDNEVFDAKQFPEILEAAGRRIGLMDFRPKFGRFDVESIG